MNMAKEEHEMVVTTTERTTVELCAAQLRPGVRCILRRGHGEHHECHRIGIPSPIRWK